MYLLCNVRWNWRGKLLPYYISQVHSSFRGKGQQSNPFVPTNPSCPIPFSCGNQTSENMPLVLPRRNSYHLGRGSAVVDAPPHRPASASCLGSLGKPPLRQLRARHCTWKPANCKRLPSVHLRQRAEIEWTR